MRRRFLTLLVILGLGLPAAAHAYDLATNGDFESGNLAGWQVYTDQSFGGIADWFVTDQPESPISGNGLDPAPGGAFQAVADEEGVGTMILYRDFAIPATLKATLKLTYWINNTGADYSDAGDFYAGGGPNQKVRIDLQDPASSGLLDQEGILANYFRTNGSTPLHRTATTITRDLTPFAGSTVRLRIAVVVTDRFMNVGIDDVSLEVSPFEPLITNLEGAHHGDAAWGDFDNDDDLDLAIGGATNDANLNVVYRHNGDGTMSIAPLGLPLQQKNAYAWGDYDNDGDVDLAMMGYGLFPETEIYRNDTGVFTPIGAGLWNLADGAMAWGDYDNDGDLDLVTTGWDGFFTGYCILYRNDGEGSFVYVANPTPGIRNGSIEWGDFDADGNLDLLTCGLHPDIFSPSRATQLARGDGAGNFTLVDSGLPGVDDGMARWADFDGDGFLDVAIAGETGSGPLARVYTYAPGLGTYSAFVALTAVRGASLGWGDFDNDGDPDLALAGTTGAVRSTSVYRNDGGAALVNIAAALPGVQDGVVLWADYDGDRDLDVLVSGDTGAGFISHVYRNTTPVANAAPSPPIAFGSSVQETGVLFASYSPVDDHSLSSTMNLRIGSSANGVDIISPMANVGTGYRHVVQTGNNSSGASRFVKFSGLGHGTIHWAFQAIDGSFIGGPFAAEQTVVLGADLLSITDVPGDQGGRVRLTIGRSPLDHASRTQFAISGYNVWRRVAAGSLAGLIAQQGTPVKIASDAVESAGRFDLSLVEWGGRRFADGAVLAIASAFPPGTWELVGSFFSQQQAQYLYNSPTAADSGVGGSNRSAFVVTAHTTVPSVWFASEPDSGTSVDNLSPAMPAPFTGQYVAGTAHLHWNRNLEADLAGYRLYRGSSAAFVPGPGNLVAALPDTGYADVAGAPYAYKLTAIDSHGNESLVATLVLGGVVGVDATAGSILSFATPSPNPARSGTTLHYTLSRAGHVRLSVYDAAGRRVVVLRDGELTTGAHSETFALRDGAGRDLPSGLYLLRLEAEGRVLTRRIAAVR